MAFADVFGRDPLEFWLLGGLALLMLAALVRTAWRRRVLRFGSREADPFLVFPEDTVRRPIAPAPLGRNSWAETASEGEDREVVAPRARHSELPSRMEPAPPAVEPPAAPVAFPIGGGFRASAPVPRTSWSTRPTPRPAAVVDEASETIRLPTAADGTVQLLPGLLVMTEGPEVGREFRFLRIGTQAVPEVTIGRASGPPYRHIQLPAATVSRMHARIRYQEGSWHVANLSLTNPLRINGEELTPMQDVPLMHGDRIQLGEVELIYRDGRP